MKKGKAQGPDDIPVEALIALGNKGVELLVNFFIRLSRGEKMPDEWRKSVLVPLYRGKGDIKECGNYRGIKLMSHTMKLWEGIIEARIGKEVTIAEQQFGFMLGKSTTDAIFCLRIESCFLKYDDDDNGDILFMLSNIIKYMQCTVL